MGSKQHLQANASWPWETTVDGKPVGSFEVFNQGQTLRFTIAWSDKAQEIHDNTTNSGIRNAHNEFLNNNQLSNHIMSNYDSGKW
ncbi:hypothetical protein KUTeg_004318 [Tegillarca granosa]|uniref:Uncharacterized protein n=1 Tax=Tegillarca granosa TaxID=220873 RepID=A0ABQ9FTB4_TEGGR|nr:hypothetical protein KUTeg_004318 [Tegillarca granosa]